jgi:predicted DNA-binding mobile mystery protein A
MPDFMQRRQWARALDRSSERLADVIPPKRGWIATMRYALGMSADQVALRIGVSRNAVYQAERSEKGGAVSLKQMERLAEAMGGRFVYAIVPNEPVEVLKYKQAISNAHYLAKQEPNFSAMTLDDQQDWVDDVAAQQLHEQPVDFWAVQVQKD